MRQFHNRGWNFYPTVQSILPNGSGAHGHHAFYPSSADSALVIDDEPQLPAAEPTELAQESHVATAVACSISESMDDTGPVPDLPALVRTHDTEFTGVNFTIPHLPPPPPSTTGSSTGKRTRHDALLDVESDVFTYDTLSQSEPLSTPLASATLVVSMPPSTRPTKKQRSARVAAGGGGASSGSLLPMTSVARAAKLTPATAVVGMQGSINRIGDILEMAVHNAAHAAHTQAAPPTPPAYIKVASSPSTTLERAMHIMDTEDADLPAEDLGMLMMVFSNAGNERAMEIYIQSRRIEVRRAYIKSLIADHKAKKM
jgi:hypothetical protein